MSYGKSRADLNAARGEKLKESVQVCMLVKVLAFDAAAMTVDVQPLNKRKIEGEYASASPLVGVPVATLCSGEFVIRPWYKRGDTGLVIFCDVDTDAALEGGGEEVEPNTSRNHAPEDGFFIGGISLAGKVPSGLPSNALVLAAGSTSLAVAPGKVTITGDVDITGMLTAGGINLNTHTHSGVESGGSSTNGPQ